MKAQWSKCGRFAGVVCLASLLSVFVTADRAVAQQGKYITEATVELIKMVNTANGAGYKLQDNSFSIGGGWLRQSASTWVPLYTVQLQGGRDYRFLASGDADARDVDLRVLDSNNQVVASDASTARNALVNYRPTNTGRFTVQIRLYSSANNLPCVCLGIVMSK
ncbi:MAG: hypothetical protein HYX68_15220 [Planctomycetes bacterium]|nr:hypothetical protein [Planctomycetota bacterium]